MHAKPETAVTTDWDRRGLPAWTYRNRAFFDLEMAELMLNHWQLVGHVSDIADAGDYLTFDMGNERALVLRGKDGEVRAFSNMCRHRGSRVVTEDSGHCRHALVCPFHGWVYNFDGTLRNAAQPTSFPPLDKVEFGLSPLECEIWNGLVFIRFRPGPQPSIADVMAPFAAEIGLYAGEDLVCSTGSWSNLSPVNWKSVRDVDNEGYHVAMAHPALQDLYGSNYHDEPMNRGISRSVGIYNAHGGRRWSVRHYLRLQQEKPHLPDTLRKAWLYWGLFPNTVIAATPESFQFYQDIPVSPGKTLVRSRVYHRRVEDRQTRLSRYLAYRIDRDTAAEDVQLTIWSDESMKSSAFKGFFLSDLEKGVRAHHDHIRARLPVATLDEEPASADLASLNAAMRNGVEQAR